MAVFALASGTAVAADLPAPAPDTFYKAPPPPPPTWTGCYINAGGGYGLFDAKHNVESATTLAAITSTSDFGGQGWFGAAGGGCDYQFHLLSWDFVVGAFGDYDLMGLNGTSTSAVGTSGSVTEQSAWAGGARAGLLVTPTLLTYVNGGYTGTHIGQINLASAFPPFASNGTDIAASSHNGWFIGGGTEYALTYDWLPIRGLFWRNEYRFSTYQAADLPVVFTASGAATGVATHSQYDIQTIATELVWRFNWSGPISTRY